MPPNIKKFRTAILPVAIFVFIGGMAWSSCLIVVRYGRLVDGRALTVASGYGLIFSFVWSWLMALFLPVGFSAEGIHGYSFWGRRRFVAWPAVTKARTFGLLNLKYLRIYGADGRVTWLPLFPSKRAEFQQEIRKFAPVGNPVLDYIL
jgi:hypothetical protein